MITFYPPPQLIWTPTRTMFTGACETLTALQKSSQLSTESSPLEIPELHSNILVNPAADIPAALMRKGQFDYVSEEALAGEVICKMTSNTPSCLINCQ